MKNAYTPTQTIGPFFHHGLQWAVNADRDAASVNTLVNTLTGLVLDADGTAVSDALIEAWSPSAMPPRELPAWQRVYTDARGCYSLQLSPQSGQPAALITLFARGMLRHAFTAVFTNAADNFLLAQIPLERRGTLIAQRLTDAHWEWDVHLQGPAETVFLEYL